jgi:hypothetical protein
MTGRIYSSPVSVEVEINPAWLRVCGLPSRQIRALAHALLKFGRALREQKVSQNVVNRAFEEALKKLKEE